MNHDWIILPVVASLVAVLINRYLFFVTAVSAYSMYPVLKPGHQLFTVRIYRPKHIKRGDILVFYSDELGGMMVKRAIGLPSDVVDFREGVLFVNQTRYDEPYVVCRDKFSGTFHVPARHYLFLGDNRVDSVDSRIWQEPYIPESNLRGKAILRIFPPHRL